MIEKTYRQCSEFILIKLNKKTKEKLSSFHKSDIGICLFP